MTHITLIGLESVQNPLVPGVPKGIKDGSCNNPRGFMCGGVTVVRRFGSADGLFLFGSPRGMKE